MSLLQTVSPENAEGKVFSLKLKIQLGPLRRLLSKRSLRFF